jgi:hypothetical protein
VPAEFKPQHPNKIKQIQVVLSLSICSHLLQRGHKKHTLGWAGTIDWFMINPVLHIGPIKKKIQVKPLNDKAPTPQHGTGPWRHDPIGLMLTSVALIEPYSMLAPTYYPRPLP